MKTLDDFYAKTIARIESDAITAALAYVTISKEPHALEVLFNIIKDALYKDASVQPTNEVSESKDSKEN